MVMVACGSRILAVAAINQIKIYESKHLWSEVTIKLGGRIVQDSYNVYQE